MTGSQNSYHETSTFHEPAPADPPPMTVAALVLSQRMESGFKPGLADP